MAASSSRLPLESDSQQEVLETKQQKITLSVFFSGTGHAIENFRFVFSVLHRDACNDETHQKMGFDGCALEKGALIGGIFGFGLDEQCEKVLARVNSLLERSAETVTVNAYGHSRGGVACLLLAKKLAGNPRIEVNLVIHDPVSGNWIGSAYLDGLGLNVTLTSEGSDVSACDNLHSALVIYPVLPLPDIMAHAPLLPVFPQTCEVRIELTLGCHLGAQDLGLNSNNAMIACHLAVQAMTEKGTHFESRLVQRYLTNFDEQLLGCYERSINFHLRSKTPRVTSRMAHRRREGQSVTLELDLTAAQSGITHKLPAGWYVSPTHRAVAEREAGRLGQAVAEFQGYITRFSPEDFRDNDHLTHSSSTLPNISRTTQ